MRFSRMVLAVVLLFVAVYGVVTASQAKPVDDQQQLFRLERRMFEAIRTKDRATAASILADDFVLRSPYEHTEDKASFLKAFDLPFQIQKVWSDDMMVHIYGDTAIVTGRQHATVHLDAGREATSVQAFADVFAKRNGRWLMVFAHSVEIPAQKKQ